VNTSPSTLLALGQALASAFPGRAQAIRALLLADVCPVPINVLFLGPPGTAKTTVARTYAKAVGHGFGARTLNAWTEDASLLGAVDIAALQQGTLTRKPVSGLLTTSSMYLLDELPRAGRGVKDLALSALAERLTPDGTPVPAHVVVATANTRLVDEEDHALADRFPLRVPVLPTSGADLRRVLTRSVSVDGARQAHPAMPSVDPRVLQGLRDRAAEVDMPGVVADALVTLAETLRLAAPQGQRHPYVSERRWVIATRLLQASAVLHDRDAVTFQDMLEVLPMVLDDGEDTRAAISAALSSSIPAWVSALDDVRKACAAAVSLATLIEVDRAPVSPAQAQAHAGRDGVLSALADAMREHGAAAHAEAKGLVSQALDACDDAVAAGLKASKARRA
jgi:MoxR-like ATPase